jgi:putative redox protein
MIQAHTLDVPYRVEFGNGTHRAVADVPVVKGGAGNGFGPHELLEAALATCMAITVRKYASENGIPLRAARIEVRIDRSAPDVVVLKYSLTLDGPISNDDRARLTTAAANCPVARTLAADLSCRLSEGC